MSFPAPGSRCFRVFAAAMALLVLAFPLRAAGDGSAFFGSDTAGEASLTGILYDLKQTQERTPTGVDVGSYITIVDEFVSKGFSEDVLNRYYRTTRPVYTTQIYIPLMTADAAPKAFGVEKIVRPSRWIIHYKGQVSPPADGTYRFAGYCDDLMIVAVNGKVVLNGSRKQFQPLPHLPWKSPEPPGPAAGNGSLVMGDWMPLTVAHPVDLDIIIGEHPGGQFCAFLSVQKEGETYEMIGGKPVLPLFQVAPHPETPASKAGIEHLGPARIWKCLQ